MGKAEMHTKTVSHPTGWRDWLAWEVSPLIGGIVRFALSVALGRQVSPERGYGTELFVAVVVFWMIAILLMLIGYFALYVLRMQALWSFVVAGVVLGAGIFGFSSSLEEIILNGASGAVTGAAFFLIRGKGIKTAQPGATDNPGDAQ